MLVVVEVKRESEGGKSYHWRFAGERTENKRKLKRLAAV